MKKIDNYLEQLAAVFCLEFFTQKHMYNLSKGKRCDHNTLILMFDSKTPGVCNCVNTKCLAIHPTNDKPHHLLVDEVWIGFDGDGSPWSDHMGGKDIDCSGMTFQSSIDHVIKEIVIHFNHLMK